MGDAQVGTNNKGEKMTYKVTYKNTVNGQIAKASAVTRFEKIRLGLGLILFGK